MASGATLSNTGRLAVRSGGMALNTVVNNVIGFGADKDGLFISGGGTASGTQLNSGGYESVKSGGIDSGTTINSGGSEFVSSGGTAIRLLISGGSAELGVGSIVSGAITFGSVVGGLRIDGATGDSMPTNTISGFVPGDTINLARVRFDITGSITLKAGNVLEIKENGITYDLNLDPSQSFSGWDFKLSVSSVGHGTNIRLGGQTDDFNRDRVSDILFRDDLSGDTWVELISNGAFGSWNQIGGSSTSYAVAGVGDFYGTGTSDALFRNIASGDTWFEAISNGAFAGWNQIGGSDTTYSVVGVADFYGNGTDDILFRNNSSGDTWLEAISNGAFAGWNQIGGSDTHYAVVGTGDFYGNGTDDILLRNNSTGDTWFEQISNGAFLAWNQIGGSDTHYSVVGVGDFFGNGIDDILFRNASTGDTWIEQISNGALKSWQQVLGSGGPNNLTSYAVVGVGDYFANGTQDILFRNNSTGDTWFEAIANGSFNGWHQIGGSNTSYTVKT